MTQPIEDVIRARIDDFFRAMDTQDLDLMLGLLPDSASQVHVGTDTDEIWRGREAIVAATREQFETLTSYDARVYDLSVTSSASGSVAWYSHRLDARIVSGGQVTEWTGARFTGVFERHDGTWKMMQTHVSVPESTAG